ncbi:MAG: hypothetical protein Q8R78_06220 [Candidatus Omnitrophota bacterium]|nr:hypothetical protein [Candidatus Omnitrophota bacterium]
MPVKTTLTIDGAIYKAAKRVAVEYDTSVSAMVRKGLLIYCSDPEAVEDTVGLLMDKRAMQAIRAGEEARRRRRKNYYIEWDQIRDV